FTSMFAGEDVDARRERPGWDLPGATDDGWRAALPAPDRKIRLKAQGAPPIAIHRRFETVAITEPKPGVFVYDLGQNFAGRPEMVVRGPAGAAVKLTPAEVLGDDGLAWQRSFNAGPDRWVLYNYTLAGQGEERFVPRFNYHGFRYLQVEGAVPTGRANPGGKPEIVSLAGQFLYADLPQVGTFTCSDKLLERTHHLIERAVVSNAYSVLTDCPHREKLGWLEQAHLNALTVIYNRDASTMYEKMIGDIVDTQQPDGMVPGIAPEYTAFLEPDGSDQPARNSPEWGSAVVLAPWAAYRAYGDAKVLADGYPAMRAYVDYLARRAQDHIVDFGLGDWYDVGPGKLGASQLTSRALTGTATSYQALTTLALIAGVLGRPAAEAADYRKRAEAIRTAFNTKFFDAQAGSYDRGSQTANAMPLALGMVPRGQEGRVLDALVRAVRARQNGVMAGDVGFHYVVRALAENGRDDVVLDMMSVTDRPSYGYQLAKGATALTEAWDADPTKSLNHFMLGHGEGWLFGGLAGINVDFAAAPDRVITLAPKPVGTVAATEATFRTVLGPVRSAWRREGGVLSLEVDVPAGAQATVRLPTSAPAQAREGGLPIAGVKGVRSSRVVAGGLEMVVGSGRYRFAAPV
uniref:alpha-L-rhamnosidase n=1 Tax=uncultured Caulobacter sp. TaxID=158749 RepID=UPI0025EB7CDB